MRWYGHISTTSVLASVTCQEQSLHPYLPHTCQIALFAPTAEMVESGCISIIFIGPAILMLKSSGVLLKIPGQNLKSTWSLGNQSFSCD